MNRVKRPDYGLYNPEIKGNKLLSTVLKAIALIIFIWYSVYFIDSFRYIITLQIGFTGKILNIVTLIVEGSISYYSILLLIHLAKGYDKVNAPLLKKYTIQNINNVRLPFVTIMLPLYREPFSVVKQSIDAALDINYPRDRYTIAVVDDSPDNSELKNYCDKNNLQYITRKNRAGFKAGAVNNALQFVKGEYILFIDADHIIERNIIKNCLIAWRENSIAVQTRIDFVNMRTFLTTISGFLQILFFSLFQRARRSTGSAIFAGGSALFSLSKLKGYGGFDPLTIADDTDNSFIFRTNGDRIEYIDVVGAWALVPWDPLHLIRQIWRWLTGITRSFRARNMLILRKTRPLYVKLDHWTTGFMPTLSIISWGSAFIVLIMIHSNIKLYRTPLLNYGYFGMILGLIGIIPILTGIGAILNDDKRSFFHKKNPVYKFISIIGFYALMLAAQPLLIGAIFKGLTGWKVSFNRTPKEKKVEDKGLSKIKQMYLLYTTINFIVGIILILSALNNNISDSRSITLIISGYASVIPLIIALLWYWKLESYLDRVADITALQILNNEAISY